MSRACALLLVAGIAFGALSRRTRAAAPPTPTSSRPIREVIGHWSDCAVNGGPALPAGPCNCGGFRYPAALH